MFKGKTVRYVTNSDGELEIFRPEKIIGHLEMLARGEILGGQLKPLEIDTINIGASLLKVIKEGISTAELDEQAYEVCLGLYSLNPKYETLAARIFVSRHLKNVKSYCIKEIGEEYKKGTIYSIAKILTDNNILAGYIGRGMMEHHERLTQISKPLNNFKLSFRGAYMMYSKDYLLSFRKSGKKRVIETPDFMIMRVAFSIVASQKCWTGSEQYLRRELQKLTGSEEFETIWHEKQFLFKRQEDMPVETIEPRVLTEADFLLIEKIYCFMSSRLYTHATPTLFNAGFINPQLSSCFIMSYYDNLSSIADNWDATAQAQKNSGGVGKFMGHIRTEGTPIKGTNGISNGHAPLNRVIDAIGHYIDQGGGKRSGSIAPYYPDWNADLLGVLELRKTHDSKQAETQHKLYYAVIISDLFARIYLSESKNENPPLWYTFCPTDADKLNDLFDEKFDLSEKYVVRNPETEFNEVLYNKFKNEGMQFTAEFYKLVHAKKYKKSYSAKKYINSMLEINAQSGVPYYVSKDNMNRNRAQNDVIHSSNLCAEIMLPTNEKEIAVCNLSSLNVSKFFTKKFSLPADFNCECNTRESHFHETADWLIVVSYKFNGEMEFYKFKEKLLQSVVQTIVRSLDRIIDINYYPRPEMRYSNEKRRPIGIGIMNLAGALAKMRIPFGSPAAMKVTAYFQEAVYYFGILESAQLAQELGPHVDFAEYPAARGELQPHLYAKNFKILIPQRKDWAFAAKQATAGLRNSVITALMPTGNTSIIMGASACFESHVSNISRWKSGSRELLMVNKHILRDAADLGLNTDFVSVFNAKSGDVFKLPLNNYRINKSVRILKTEENRFKQIYRTTWQIKPREIIFMAAARQPYVDQSQSMSLWISEIDTNVFNHLLLGMKLGLKTLCYYMHSQPATKEQEMPCAGGSCTI